MGYDKPIYGIIGNPLKHSLSPLMHNAAFKEMGVDASYELFPLQEKELDNFFAELKKETSAVFGLNVTVPYKEKVIFYLDSIAPFADKAGAVNTIVITHDRKLVGYNTDGPGFIAHLSELGFNPANKTIAVLGAGGSARAIIASLCLITDRPYSIIIYNRTPERLDSLLSELGQRLDLSCVEPARSIDDLQIEMADMLINATPVGLSPRDPALVEESLLHPGMLVYDLIYNPRETVLLKMAKERGAMATNGLGMLYYQGVLSLQHWVNIQLDQKVKKKMRKSLEEAIS